MATRPQHHPRALLGRSVVLLVLPAVGCSLIIPLDYTGGTPAAGAGNAGFAGSFAPAVGGSAGQGGSGESGGVGGSAGRGGSGGKGGSGARGGSGGTAGSGNEGPGGEAGTGPSGGSSGSGGAGMGGEAGETGGAGAGGVAGDDAGMGGTAGSGACPGIDLETDPEHCGSCTHACLPGSSCSAGSCIDSPCQKLCAPAITVPLQAGDGYRVDNIGTGATCHQVSMYDPSPNLPAIIAWEFESTRTLKVNGVSVTPEAEPGAPLDMPRRAGGYCIQASAGMRTYAGYKLPLPSQLTP